MVGTESGPAVCHANALPAVLSCQYPNKFIFMSKQDRVDENTKKNDKNDYNSEVTLAKLENVTLIGSDQFLNKTCVIGNKKTERGILNTVNKGAQCLEIHLIK